MTRLPLALFLVLFVGCTEADTSSSADSGDLAGTWVLEEQQRSSAIPSGVEQTLTFGSDGRFVNEQTSEGMGARMEGTYRVAADTLYLTVTSMQIDGETITTEGAPAEATAAVWGFEEDRLVLRTASGGPDASQDIYRRVP